MFYYVQKKTIRKSLLVYKFHKEKRFIHCNNRCVYICYIQLSHTVLAESYWLEVGIPPDFGSSTLIIGLNNSSFNSWAYIFAFILNYLLNKDLHLAKSSFKRVSCLVSIILGAWTSSRSMSSRASSIFYYWSFSCPLCSVNVFDLLISNCYPFWPKKDLKLYLLVIFLQLEWPLLPPMTCLSSSIEFLSSLQSMYW